MQQTVTNPINLQQQLNRSFYNSIALRSNNPTEDSHIFNTIIGEDRLVKVSSKEFFINQLVEIDLPVGTRIGKYVGLLEKNNKPAFAVIDCDKLFVDTATVKIKKI